MAKEPLGDDDMLARENASIEEQAARIVAKDKVKTEGESEKAEEAIGDLLAVKLP